MLGNFFKCVVVLVFTCVSFRNTAQSALGNTGSANPNDIEFWLSKNQLRNFNNESSIVGDRYLNNDWSEGTFQTIESEIARRALMKYDEVQDVLLVKIQEKEYVLDASKVMKFSLGSRDDSKGFISYDYNGASMFFELFHEGDFLLLIQQKTTLVKKDVGNAAYGSGQSFDKYVKTDQKYIVSKGEIAKYSGSKKELLNLFGEKADEVASFIGSQKLKTNDLDDLLLIFKTYDGK